MSWVVDVRHTDAHLLVTASGAAGLAVICATVDFVATATRLEGRMRAMVDLRAATLELSFTEHLQLGEHCAAVLKHLERFATVARLQDRVGTSEKAAQRHGLRLRSFSDMQEALEWLGGGGPEPVERARG
jgi:hypothetical protein